MSNAFAATMGVKTTAAAKAPAFLNMFLLLESLTAESAEVGLDIVDGDENASEDDDRATSTRAERSL